MARPRSYSDEALAEAIRDSFGFEEAASKLGLHKSGGSVRFQAVHQRLDTSHFKGRNVDRHHGKADLARSLLRDGLPQSEVARRAGISAATVSYHARRLGRSVARKKYDWAEIGAYYDAGHTMRECIERFQFGHASWSKALATGRLKVTREPQLSLDELLAPERKPGRSTVKSRLLKAGVLTDKCEICGIAEWLGRKLSLHLDHKNGRKFDNRPENLRLLCPNCHSQTPTYGGKNNTGKSSRGKTTDSESVNEGSTPSFPTTASN